ncbi:MAG TPA: hypothetical protein VHZ25_17935 [Acidobacteriaceae bacterium]|jgi:hypothetical protein|nr:hypothetical protein [Acidobacteriaceae bacterium]
MRRIPDDSRIVIGGLPLDLLDAELRRQVLENEVKKFRCLALWFSGYVVVIGLLVGILASGNETGAGSVRVANQVISQRRK